MTTRDYDGDLATLIGDEIRIAAGYLSLQPHTAVALAAQVEDRVRLRMGGVKSYVAQIDRKKRIATINAEFTGANQADLARKHGLSVRRIEQIVKSRSILKT